MRRGSPGPPTWSPGGGKASDSGGAAAPDGGRRPWRLLLRVFRFRPWSWFGYKCRTGFSPSRISVGRAEARPTFVLQRRLRSLLQLLFQSLPPIQIRVVPLVREQRVVRAALHDLALVEGDDVVGVFERRHAVGDEQRR